ncbi:hypothetical protein PHLGIDRAFT_130689 [Phlebiopsis gigantea 11061_1 CR5-6]|uniref:ABM domain-containing protein n=1 Tax=Phlebiopsis gigantea (strain 11061_1 CR5-6) TaxID=745531 RepID=A0A0C3NDD1_PHLG1|nr:hypothetical protein PHLGIDRAFT_130689 [Phlebiopsis gigantea 11061_1 CR5-6]
MTTVVEMLFTPTTEAYRHDPSKLDPALEYASAAKGCLGIYHGTVVEDPSQLLLIVVWKTLEDHQALMNNQEVYPKLLEAFAPSGDITQGDMFHVHFTPDSTQLASVLNAPYTSYSYVLSLKPGKDAARAEVAFKGLAGVTGVNGCYGGIMGKVVERNEQILLFGWDDPKFHESGRTLEGVWQLRQEIHETVDKFKAGHVCFTTYKKFEA